MQVSITLFSVILLLGAAQGLFLALALLNTKTGNPIAQRLLAMLTVVFAVDLSLEFLHQTHYLIYAPHLLIVEPSLNLLYGPLIYLYALSLTKPQITTFAKKFIRHFIAFFASLVLMLPACSLNQEQLMEMIYQDIETPTPLQLWLFITTSILLLISAISIGSYLAASMRILAFHRRAIVEQFSSIEQISLNWLRNLLLALSLLYAFYLFDLFFSDYFKLDEKINDALYFMIVATIYIMGYMGLRQPMIFSAQMQINGEQPRPKSELDSQHSTKTKYEKSALDTSASKILLESLIHYMATQQPHLNNKLSLSELAKQLDISSNYLSQIINQQLNKNFFDFINEQRVESAKQLLNDKQNAQRSILDIALSAGFNSKSAFYTAFKKHTGVTPSEFRQTQHIHKH